MWSVATLLTLARMWAAVRVVASEVTRIRRLGGKFAYIKKAITEHSEPLQELSNILESLASQRANVGSQGDKEEAGTDQDDDESNQEDEAASKAQAGAGLLQTFVFSATLTLPQKLRKRLRKGVH